MNIKASICGIQKVKENIYIWMNEAEFHTFIGMIGKQLQDLQIWYKETKTHYHIQYNPREIVAEMWVILKLVPDNSFDINKIHISLDDSFEDCFILNQNWKDIYESE